jgi:predicted enzyme related to lactoylglutathione lyase
MVETEIILYIKDQVFSKKFYAAILGIEPVLDVPGMTEFLLNQHTKLGLMPDVDMDSIIGQTLPTPVLARGIPRCELYLFRSDINAAINNAIIHGARLLSPAKLRSWGHMAAYIADPDGHIIAFANETH